MEPNEQSVFAKALEIQDPKALAAFLDRACAGHGSLRQNVASLLAAYTAGEFLESPASVLVGKVDAPGSTERPGAVIGPYKLLEQIGEGGFGVVFMAEQIQPIRRKVALKVIKPGMDTRQVIARFEAERQALALMDHPNIARVLDAGETASGRPYFVMELVRGVPITHFCDRSRLAPRQRLELYLPVCQAIQHAHQKGVIHRDIKPSNVLVTLHDGTAVVKVIDFGIVKAIGQQLTEKTLFTNFAQMVGTPLYMSPEQAEMSGLDIDTRTDIYSLGVLLYELLTGTTPFDRERLREASLDEIRRIIREEEPPKPSTRVSTLAQAATAAPDARRTDTGPLSQLLRGDLDWIVMKALEKERGRRYATANGLARDIQRYLQDEPVEARPPSSWYKFRKFARRNKRMLLAASVLTVALVLTVAALATSAVFFWQDKRRAEEALNQTQQAQQVEAQARQRASQSFYFQSIARADLELANNNVGRADQILDACPPDYRHWEWRYLKQLCHADVVTLRGHGGPVYGVAFSPDGRRIASAGSDKTVKIWDVAAGKELLSLPGHRQIVTCVAFSADGRLLASGSGWWDDWRPGEIKIWDAATGRELFSLSGHQYAIGGLAISPDSQLLASANWDGSVRLWNLTTRQEVRTLVGHRSSVKCIAFSPDGQRLASGSHDRVIILWDVPTGQPLATLRGHAGDVHSVAFSPDGRRLGSGSWDHTVRVWDVSNGQELFAPPLRHGDIVWGIAFSPDGQRLASASGDGSVKLWQASTGQELASLRGHSWKVHGVAFSPGGRCLASSSGDHTVKVWDLTASQHSFRASARGFRSALSADGQQLALGCLLPTSHLSAGRLSVYDVRTGQEVAMVAEHQGGFRGAAFSPDRRRLAADWGTAVKIWDIATRRELLTLVGHTGAVTRVAFSPDNQRLASASADQTVKLWDATTGRELMALAGHRGPLTGVVFSPNGQRLVSASKDHTVKIWDASTGHELRALRGHDGPVTDVAFSPQGDRLASASEDRTVRVWDTATGQTLLVLPGHTVAVTAVAFGADGERLASASADGSVRVWDARSGQEALTFRGLLRHAYGVAFSADGERLVASGEMSGGAEGFRVWETKESNQDKQAARDLVLREDAQIASYTAGRARADRGEWDQAVKAYTKAIDLGTIQAQVWPFRGNAYARLGRWQLAAADFDEAIQRQPNDSAVWYWHTVAHLGAADRDGYHRACAAMLQRFGKTTDPVVARQLVYACAPLPDALTDPAPLILLARIGARGFAGDARVLGAALYRVGKHDLSVQQFEQVSRVYPLRAWDWLFLALAHQRLDHADQAFGCLVEAVRWIRESHRQESQETQKLWIGWWERVEVEHLFHEAQAQIQGAVADPFADPADTRMNSVTEAAVNYTKTLKQPPLGPADWLQRGRAAAAGGAWTEAVRNYVKAVDLSPADLELWYEHASLLLLAGDLEGYRQTCAILLERLGPNPQPRPAYLVARACALAADAGVDSARIVQLAEQAMEASPTTAWYVHTLSLAYYRAGQFERAIKLAHASLEANPKWEPYVLNWFVLSMAHHHLGHTAEARQWLTKAVGWLEQSAAKTPADALANLPMTWHDKFACPLLQREAQALQNAQDRLPATAHSPE